MKIQRSDSFGCSKLLMSQKEMERNNGGLLYGAKSTRKVKLSETNSLSVKKNSLYKQGFEFCKKVRERLNSSSDYQMGFLKYIHACSIGKIGKSDLKLMISGSISKYPDLIDGFDDFVKHCEDIAFDNQLESIQKIREKDSDTIMRENSNPSVFGKADLDKVSIQELDLSKCLVITPSYQLLPKDYPVTMASRRSKVGAHLLNDFWVCTASGNKNYTPKIRGRNKYQQELDRCESDQYEFDMLLKSTRSAAEHVEELVDGIKEKKIKLEGPFKIEDHLSVLNLRCIERLYDERGYEMLGGLNRNPKVALPLILSRLKQRVEELAEIRSDLNKDWAQVYAKNHHKSLQSISTIEDFVNM
ncbi:hypothetical protein Q3G72_033190 [Acer saccharum]|nr:hypothetical protein Q3G72_033190 [Acer saccharum]